MAFLDFGCTGNKGSEENIKQILSELKENQTKVIMRIDGKEFYPAQSLFTGQMTFTDQMLSLVLVDQFEGRTMLNLGGEKWYQQPIVKEVSTSNMFNASLKLGKLIDKENLIGEGYMMTDGKIEAVSFARDRIVFKITGKVGKYSDFQQPEKYLTADGLIVCKMPAITWTSITEDEIFGSNKLDK
ncbi:hypothetical protein LZG72_17165 [Dyadobacter sp. CY323]|nr:hypothetical protein [Dyadobacter sp. CY323]